MAMAHQSSLCQLYQLGGCCCQQKLRAWLHSVPATKVSMAVSFTSTWVRSNCKSRLILLRLLGNWARPAVLRSVACDLLTVSRVNGVNAHISSSTNSERVSCKAECSGLDVCMQTEKTAQVHELLVCMGQSSRPQPFERHRLGSNAVKLRCNVACL